MKIEGSRDVTPASVTSLSFAHLFSFSRINLITGRETVSGKGGRRGRDCRPRENVIWIRPYDDSNRNSTERTRHRLEIRFEFAGGDERTEVAMGASGRQGRGCMVGPKAHRSFMGHLLGIPVKPTSSRPSAVSLRPSHSPWRHTPATPCASLHHSLVRRNGSGSGGYNIFLEDSFSSAVDHGTVAAALRRRTSDGVTPAIRLAWSTVHEAITLEFGSLANESPPLFRWPCRPEIRARHPGVTRSH